MAVSIAELNNTAKNFLDTLVIINPLLFFILGSGCEKCPKHTFTIIIIRHIIYKIFCLILVLFCFCLQNILKKERINEKYV